MPTAVMAQSVRHNVVPIIYLQALTYIPGLRSDLLHRPRAQYATSTSQLKDILTLICNPYQRPVSAIPQLAVSKSDSASGTSLEPILLC